MTRILYAVAEFLSRPSGFCFMIAALLADYLASRSFGLYSVEGSTNALSYAAILIGAFVLVGQRRAGLAEHAKLDRLIACAPTSNDLIRAEQKSEEEIERLRP